MAAAAATAAVRASERAIGKRERARASAEIRRKRRKICQVRVSLPLSLSRHAEVEGQAAHKMHFGIKILFSECISKQNIVY